MDKIISKKIRVSAKDQQCTVNSPSCNYQSETTVFAHLPLDGGMGTKPTDLSGCYACSNCHDIIDRRTISSDFEQDRDWYLRRAQSRTIAAMVKSGVLEIK